MKMHQQPRIAHNRKPQELLKFAVTLEPAAEPIQIAFTHDDLNMTTQRLTMTRAEATALVGSLTALLATPADGRGVTVVPAATMAEATHRIPTNIHWGKGWFGDGFRYIVAQSDEAAVRFAKKRQCTHIHVQVRDGNGWAKLAREQIAA